MENLRNRLIELLKPIDNFYLKRAAEMCVTLKGLQNTAVWTIKFVGPVETLDEIQWLEAMNTLVADIEKELE